MPSCNLANPNTDNQIRDIPQAIRFHRLQDTMNDFSTGGTCLCEYEILTTVFLHWLSNIGHRCQQAGMADIIGILTGCECCWVAAWGQLIAGYSSAAETSEARISAWGSLTLGSSRPRPLRRSITLRMRPRIRAATPRQASITRGQV